MSNTGSSNEESAQTRSERYARHHFTAAEVVAHTALDISTTNETGDQVLKRMRNFDFHSDVEAAAWTVIVEMMTGRPWEPPKARNRAERRRAQRR